MAQNVLGQKQVTLELGDTDDEAPDGYKIPAPQIEETADLDELLNALDPDTRTRLAVVHQRGGRHLRRARDGLQAASWTISRRRCRAVAMSSPS